MVSFDFAGADDGGAEMRAGRGGGQEVEEEGGFVRSKESKRK
jgi:hypothetical protein